jgi:hypothetical protein
MESKIKDRDALLIERVGNMSAAFHCSWAETKLAQLDIERDGSAKLSLCSFGWEYREHGTVKRTERG